MAQAQENVIDINQIMEMIPHRYPILLVDRIVELEHDKHIVGLKNVTFNEPHFMGHFPQTPIMPGVLIIEAMAQTAAVLVVDGLGGDAKGKLVYFMTIDDTKFRKPVVPGDSLYLHLNVLQKRGPVWKFRGEAMVDGKKVAEATISAMIADKK